jgi:beta-glucosidase
MTGVAPAGWDESGPGQFSRPDERAGYTIGFNPGASATAVLSGLRTLLEPGESIEPAGSMTTEHLEFQLYTAESSAEAFGGELAHIDFAFAEEPVGVWMITAGGPPAEAEGLRRALFVPAVEAFNPRGALDELDPVEPDAPYRDATLTTEERVEDLLSRMTMREKVGQMTQIEKNSLAPGLVEALVLGSVLSGGGGSPEENTAASWAEMVDGFQSEAMATRLGIPIIYGVDSVHGHANLAGATVFPHNVALGAADDPDLMERIGRATALETAATGIWWNFAPVVAVAQDARWGRFYESYGENPELVSRLAVSYLEGLQGDDLSDPTTVLATPKHFVGDGGTTWGSSTTSDYMIDQGVTPDDEQALRSIHLPPYIAALDSGARSVMVSFSSWGDTKMHANQALLDDLLKQELGLEGFIVSDWAAIDQISDDYYEAVVTAINAGIDMNMVPSYAGAFMWTLTSAVEAGDVATERIDDAVRRILTVKFDLGLFEHPYSDPALLSTIGSTEHRDLAREAVAKSLVLLQNDGGVLPLDLEDGLLFVGGEAADDIGIQSGGWTIEWQGAEGDITQGTTILEGVTAAAPAGVEVVHQRLGAMQRADITNPDACIAVVGERPYSEGMGDSEDLVIGDLNVVRNMARDCDELVAVVISGRPVMIAEILDLADAVVAAWLPGTEGAGVADVLFGAAPFTARLPVTWPASVDQLPLGSTDEQPLFPFGYGLDT